MITTENFKKRVVCYMPGLCKWLDSTFQPFIDSTDESIFKNSIDLFQGLFDSDFICEHNYQALMAFRETYILSKQGQQECQQSYVLVTVAMGGEWDHLRSIPANIVHCMRPETGEEIGQTRVDISLSANSHKGFNIHESVEQLYQALREANRLASSTGKVTIVNAGTGEVASF